MDTAKFIAEIEAELAAAGKSVVELCAEAQINRSTWTRWKSGVMEPNMRTLRAVRAACDALCKKTAA